MYRDAQQSSVVVEENGVKRFTNGDVVSETDAGFFSTSEIQQMLHPYIKLAATTGESLIITLEGRGFFETAETVSFVRVCVCNTGIRKELLTYRPTDSITDRHSRPPSVRLVFVPWGDLSNSCVISRGVGLPATE